MKSDLIPLCLLFYFSLHIVAARRGQMHEDWGSDARALVGRAREKKQEKQSKRETEKKTDSDYNTTDKAQARRRNRESTG